MSDLCLEEAPGEAMIGEETRLSSNARVGVLVAIADQGRSPMVLFSGQCGKAAVLARSTVDLHSTHIGQDVVLTFDAGDLTRPIVIGLLQSKRNGTDISRPPRVEVEADGQRVLVTAEEQLVLRCGKASITLTKSGKVLIVGEYVSSRSSGVNRMKGGSIQLN
jgi:Domain of unknown function (DUF6484)